VAEALAASPSHWGEFPEGAVLGGEVPQGVVLPGHLEESHVLWPMGLRCCGQAMGAPHHNRQESEVFEVPSRRLLRVAAWAPNPWGDPATQRNRISHGSHPHWDCGAVPKGRWMARQQILRRRCRDVLDSLCLRMRPRSVPLRVRHCSGPGLSTHAQQAPGRSQCFKDKCFMEKSFKE